MGASSIPITKLSLSYELFEFALSKYKRLSKVGKRLSYHTV